MQKLFGAGSIQEGQGIFSSFLKMIGLGLDFDSRTSQNLIDFFPSHTFSSVSGRGQTLPGEKKFLLSLIGEFRILSNIDLLIISEDLGLDLGIINKKYDEIFSRDNIPDKNGMYIINLDSKFGPGTHWVSVIIKPNKILYFDSFGLIPPNELINLRPEYYYNFLQYQPIKSFLCGYYCLYFLNEFNKLKLYKGEAKNSSNSIKIFNKIIKPFHINDFEYNDNFIKKYYINIYNGKI